LLNQFKGNEKKFNLVLQSNWSNIEEKSPDLKPEHIFRIKAWKSNHQTCSSSSVCKLVKHGSKSRSLV